MDDLYKYKLLFKLWNQIARILPQILEGKGNCSLSPKSRQRHLFFSSTLKNWYPSHNNRKISYQNWNKKFRRRRKIKNPPRQTYKSILNWLVFWINWVWKHTHKRCMRMELTAWKSWNVKICLIKEIKQKELEEIEIPKGHALKICVHLKKISEAEKKQKQEPITLKPK